MRTIYDYVVRVSHVRPWFEPAHASVCLTQHMSTVPSHAEQGRYDFHSTYCHELSTRNIRRNPGVFHMQHITCNIRRNLDET